MFWAGGGDDVLGRWRRQGFGQVAESMLWAGGGVDVLGRWRSQCFGQVAESMFCESGGDKVLGMQVRESNGFQTPYEKSSIHFRDNLCLTAFIKI